MIVLEKQSITKRFLLTFIALWSVLILSFYIYIHHAINKVFFNLALIEAKTAFEKDVILRRLISSLGGVYTQISDNVKPNPYLQVPNRDIETKNGMKLTLLNPAYLTRLLYQKTNSESLLKSHITSLDPINPINSPDDWEKKALLNLQNSKEKEFYELVEENGKLIFKYLQVFVTEETCLKCHGQNGYKVGGKSYKVGDIRGGISVYLDFNNYLPTLKNYILFHQISFGIIYIIGIFATVIAYKLINKSFNYFISEKSKFENLFLNSPLPMAVFDSNLGINLSNNNFKKLFSDVSVKNLKDLKNFCDKDIESVINESKKDFVECKIDFGDNKIKYFKIKIITNKSDNLIIIDDITDTKVREIEFENLIKVFDNSLNDIYIFDLIDLSIKYINHSVIERTKLDKEDFVSYTIYDIILDKNQFNKIINDLKNNNINFISTDLYLIKKDGTTYLNNCIFIKTNYQNKCLLYTIDKTLLKEYEEKFKYIFYTANNGLLLVNSEGIIEEANSFINKLGILSGENIFNTELHQIFKESLKTNNISFHKEYKVNDTTLLLDITTNKFVINNKTYILFTITDLTDYKKERDKQDKLKQELFHLQRMEVLGKITAGISHEFNNILSIILAYAESIKLEKIDNPQVKEDIEGIIKNVERASILTKKLLLFSKKNELNLELINIDSFLKNNSKIFRKLIPAYIHLKYELNCPNNYTEIDETLFFQVILNLLINAKNAIDEKKANSGEIVISTNTEFVDETTFPSEFNAIKGDYIKISVTDDGIGIKESNLNEIFFPFFTTYKSSKGVGLGLAIVYSIVKQLKGYITVKSKLYYGTTFDIYLPISKDTNIMLSKGDESVWNIGSDIESTKGKKILIVDDDTDVAITITNLLVSYGFTVKYLTSPLHSLEIIRNSDFRPDLIISDYIMPGINGIEFINQVKKIEPKAKFILMTGYSDIRVDSLLDNLDILFKPINFNRLIEIIIKRLK